MTTFSPGDKIQALPELKSRGQYPTEDNHLFVFSITPVPPRVRDVGHTQWLTIARQEGDKTMVYARVWKDGNTDEKVYKWVSSDVPYIGLVEYSGAWFRHV